jgi:Holliday junction resolvasome RuvABC ATP-dependent DNA helicase subunit
MKIEQQIDQAFEFLPKGIALCFTGPSGTGKTYNANRIAEKFGLDLVLPEDKTTQSTEKEFIMFYEEAQRMNRKEQEELLQQIDNSTFYNWSEVNGIPKLVESQVRFIFCTTHLGDLIEAIRTRCVEINFSYYSHDDMKEIAHKNFPELLEETLERMIRASKGTPRQCVKIGSYTKSYMKEMPEQEAFERALQTMGLNHEGFNRNDVLYLLTLFKGGATSEKHLSNSLGLDTKTLKDTIENYFYRYDFIEIGTRGRKLTPKGYEYVRKNLI